MILDSFIFKSLRFRICILLIAVGIIPIVVMGHLILLNYESSALAQKNNEVMSQCRILADYLSGSGYVFDSSLEAVNLEIDQMSNLYDGRVLIIDGDYRVIKDTYGISQSKTIISEEVIRCFLGEDGGGYDAKNRYLEITLPIMSQTDDTVCGVMLLSASTDSIVDAVEAVGRNTIIVELVFSIILIILSIFLANMLVKPFSKVADAIDGIEEGYGEEAVTIRTYHEMGAMIRALNKLLSRMKVLNDSRQEFVSNVSHELKTPLASMKVLSDSLITMPDAPVEMYREFMVDIASEIERENSIINDLLSLVKMDKTAGSLNIKAVNINEMVELILKRLRPIADQNNIEITFESNREVEAEIDEVKLTLAFSNLVENGIKYNRKDGWVKVVLDADHQFFTVVVSDSGIGIPQQAQDHIFERFYRVDKSHSREIGGTGLGLAITRSAILMHRGSIRVSSVEGEGTEFTVKIPLTYMQ